MFTVLKIEDRVRNEISKRLLGRLPVNSMRYRSVPYSDFTINYIDFVSRNGRVSWKRIAKRLKKTGNEVVYCSKHQIPQGVGITPFVPFELRQRLCSNMALEVLGLMRTVPKSLKIGLYDPAGDFADLAPYLLRLTDNFVVVTKNLKFYSTMSQSLLADMGAVLRVSRNISSFCGCGFIISPYTIKEKFTPMSNAVVLTCERPKVMLPCSVYYRYSFRLPKELDKLRGEDVDTEVFGGALYSLCGVYRIGSLVPFVCMNGADSQTTLSLRKYFEERFGT